MNTNKTKKTKRHAGMFDSKRAKIAGKKGAEALLRKVGSEGMRALVNRRHHPVDKSVAPVDGGGMIKQ
jgi:hypothetical protein